MNKSQHVNEVIRLYDEIERLTRENEELKKAKPYVKNEENRCAELDKKNYRHW